MHAGDVAQLVTSGTAVIALGLVVWQVRSAKRMARDTIDEARTSSRQQTTHQYIASISDADFTAHLAHTMDTLDVNAGDNEAAAARWCEFRDMSHQRQMALVVPLNRFEAIGGLYNLNHLDKDIVARQIGHTASLVYERMRWLVERLQEVDAGYFREWETMLDDLATRRTAAA